MTIQEAIRSGKPFRRPGDTTAFLPTPQGELWIVSVMSGVRLCKVSAKLYTHDLLAEDWETGEVLPSSQGIGAIDGN